METVSNYPTVQGLPQGGAVTSNAEVAPQAEGKESWSCKVMVDSFVYMIWAVICLSVVTLWTFERVTVLQISLQYRAATWAAFVIYASQFFLCYKICRRAIRCRSPWQTRHSSACYKAICFADTALFLIFLLAISVYQRAQPNNPLTTMLDFLLENVIGGTFGYFRILWFWILLFNSTRFNTAIAQDKSKQLREQTRQTSAI